MKNILVARASSGLGRALTLNYVNAETEICIADMNIDERQRAVQSVTQQGGSAFIIACDITQQSEVDKLGVALSERWQSIDILNNNAGVVTPGRSSMRA